MSHRRRFYSDEEAKALTCVIASSFIQNKMEPDFLGDREARASAFKALDAMERALARSEAAAAGEADAPVDESAFDLAVCCSLARAFAECLDAPSELYPARERVMSAIDSIASDGPGKEEALSGCLASIDEWVRSVVLLLRDGGTEPTEPEGEGKGHASSVDAAAAGRLAAMLESMVGHACRPGGPLHGIHPTRIGAGCSIVVPGSVVERLDDCRFLVLESCEAGVPIVSALGFEPVVLCGVRGGIWGRWLGAQKERFHDLAVAVFIGLDERPLVLSGGTFPEGTEVLLIGDASALTLVSAEYCRSSMKAFEEELAEDENGLGSER